MIKLGIMREWLRRGPPHFPLCGAVAVRLDDLLEFVDARQVLLDLVACLGFGLLKVGNAGGELGERGLIPQCKQASDNSRVVCASADSPRPSRCPVRCREACSSARRSCSLRIELAARRNGWLSLVSTPEQVVPASKAATNLFHLVDASPRELVAQRLQALLLIPRELRRFRAILCFAVRLFELGYPIALVL